MPGKRNKIRLAHDELWEDAPRLKGQSASGGPQKSDSGGVDHIGEYCKSYGDEPGTPGIIEAIRETPLKYLKGIKGCPSKKVTQLTAQLKGLHTKAHNKHELEATMLLESCDPLAIAETWWDRSNDCSVAIKIETLWLVSPQSPAGGLQPP
ncbi:hypothetical protein DUI87_07078 [Hirundo rustica rustica]|uniref:Uncharacterized protein n=1 Tax=Hirundo rustica rustica TaxID=333673 RepID=A0A3M0KQN1_HIRRU|nr:hypothetical protein DUI87_07078 [Hirundo rustica rustica]